MISYKNTFTHVLRDSMYQSDMGRNGARLHFEYPHQKAVLSKTYAPKGGCLLWIG